MAALAQVAVLSKLLLQPAATLLHRKGSFSSTPDCPLCDAVQTEAEMIGRELLASQVTNFSINETQFVTNLYEAFLQRGPDAAGLAFLVSNAGTDNATQRQNV